MPLHHSSMVVRNSNRLVCIFLLGHEYMMAQSEVALFLGSLVPAGRKMEGRGLMPACLPPPACFWTLFIPVAYTNQQLLECQYTQTQWEGTAHLCTVPLPLLFFGEKNSDEEKVAFAVFVGSLVGAYLHAVVVSSVARQGEMRSPAGATTWHRSGASRWPSEPFWPSWLW